MKLTHAVFYSTDIERTKTFYQEKFGLIPDKDQGVYVEYKLGDAILGIKQTGKPREVPGHQTAFLKSDEIEQDYKNVQNLNIEIYKELTHQDWGSSFAVLDCDGNKLEYIS